MSYNYYQTWLHNFNILYAFLNLVNHQQKLDIQTRSHACNLTLSIVTILVFEWIIKTN